MTSQTEDVLPEVGQEILLHSLLQDVFIFKYLEERINHQLCGTPLLIIQDYECPEVGEGNVTARSRNPVTAGTSQLLVRTILGRDVPVQDSCYSSCRLI